MVQKRTDLEESAIDPFPSISYKEALLTSSPYNDENISEQEIILVTPTRSLICCLTSNN